jgi:Arc/MetJ-type ribon-helix-helix transcriptional regulator
MMPVMLKNLFSLRLDDKLLAEAQRLVDAGEFGSLAEMVESALRDFLQDFDAAPSGDGLRALMGPGALDSAGQRGEPAHVGAAPSVLHDPDASGAALDGRMLHHLTEAYSQAERDGYERLVIAYSALAEHPLQDGEMRELAEIFKTYELEESLNGLDDAQHSRLPLSPSYLAMLLEKRRAARAGTAPQNAASFGRAWDGPERVSADFDNPLAAAVSTLYEKEIGVLTERVKEQIATYIVEFPDLERWQEAFAAAAGMNKRSLRYVLGVLRGNGAKVVDTKGRDKRGLSKSERHREAKRSRNKDYKEYWDAKLKARQDAKPD